MSKNHNERLALWKQKIKIKSNQDNFRKSILQISSEIDQRFYANSWQGSATIGAECQEVAKYFNKFI